MSIRSVIFCKTMTVNSVRLGSKGPGSTFVKLGPQLAPNCPKGKTVNTRNLIHVYKMVVIIILYHS